VPFKGTFFQLFILRLGKWFKEVGLGTFGFQVSNLEVTYSTLPSNWHHKRMAHTPVSHTAVSQVFACAN